MPPSKANCANTMRDRDVRTALHQRVLQEHHDDADTLVLDELGLRHGSCRIDIAVVNGSLHGYEIKSDADTLARLPDQVYTYSQVLDRATLVVGERHHVHARSLLPDWWGIKIARMDVNGIVTFETIKAEQENETINPVALAELLWKPEVSSILRFIGAPSAVLRQPRAHQYRHLADQMELLHLRAIVRQFLKNREGWRGPRQL
jgi:hypothetical protein